VVSLFRRSHGGWRLVATWVVYVVVG